MEIFDDIKVGEKLIMSRLWFDPQVGVVEKVTKATFTVKGIVFNKKDGHQRGAHDSYTYWHVSRATEERLAEIEKNTKIKSYVAYLQKVDYSKLPLETLEEIYNLTKN
jgi:predicted transcriptional regulator